MKKIITAIILAGPLMYSCGSSDSSADTSVAFDSSLSKSSSPVVSSPVMSNPSVTADTASPVQISGQPGVTVQPGVTMQQAVTPTVTAAGMNPPHGQPGHRCDIAVGAPLNSAPAKTTTTTTATPVTAQPAITTSTQKTAPGMNPPHGQPGHRCDIAVGAPLNSAPAKPVTATPAVKPADNQKAAEAVVPAIAENKKDSSATK